MALRRPCWPTTRLGRLSTVSAPNAPTRHEASARVNPRNPSYSRRALATHAATAATPQQHQFSEFAPPRELTELDEVLSAIQRQDPDRLYRAFLAWTDVLGESITTDAVCAQVRNLSGPTFSEILRGLDPIVAKSHDASHGLNLTAGQTQFTDTRKLVDELGVRVHHRKVLNGMRILLAVRNESDIGLTAADYEVFLRCAGAAASYQSTKQFWSAMAANGLQDSRTSKTWAEFIKSRFMTEPEYYQFDRSRVAVMARDLYSNHAPLPMATLKRMDSMRLSINAQKKEPWNRREDELDEDMRRLFRRRVDFRGYKGHWIRALYYGHEMDENLICASLIAFARSSSLHSIKTLILQNYYGIQVDAGSNPGNPDISGGADLPPQSPIMPTGKLLNALVEAFGSMSHIPMGMKLVDFISRRYDVPIPRETWSNLLSWTYVCASKPFKPMRKLHGDFKSTVTTTADVREVWNVMTSEPYSVEPTFEDYDIYVKTLLAQRSFGRALNVIRNEILPYYETVAAEYENSLLDEIAQNELRASNHSSSSSSSTTTTVGNNTSRRREQAQIYKDYVHHRISSWFDKLLKTASANKGHRTGPVMTSLIPKLLIEFDDFFPHQVRYRTAQGIVQIDRPEATRRFEWTRQFRETLPQKKAGIHVRDFEGSDSADFPYPEIDRMRVLEWKRVPKRRKGYLGKAPRDDGSERYQKWWDGVEEQLML